MQIALTKKIADALELKLPPCMLLDCNAPTKIN